MPIDQLCLSPQCGFASTVEGNALTADEQWAKLAHVVDTAARIWTEARHPPPRPGPVAGFWHPQRYTAQNDAASKRISENPLKFEHRGADRAAATVD